MDTTTKSEVTEMNGVTRNENVKADTSGNMKKIDQLDKMENEKKTKQMGTANKKVQIENIDNIDEIKPENATKSATREVTINADESPSTSSAILHSQELAARRRQFMSQPSTLATRRQQAVCVRRAHKSYGPKNNPNVILDGLNMTVPKGSMYVFAISFFSLKKKPSKI